MKTLALLWLVFLVNSAPASCKRFCVFVSGTTNGAHHSFVQKLKKRGQTEVDADADFDYVLVFCPVSSRVGTDVSEALSKAPADKPIVLVVMHHTFNHDYVVADSRRLVANNANVQLTVDCLFYENHLLDCQRNDAAWSKLQQHLSLSQHCPSELTPVGQTSCCSKRCVIIGAVIVAIAFITTIIIAVVTRKH